MNLGKGLGVCVGNEVKIRQDRVRIIKIHYIHLPNRQMTNSIESVKKLMIIKASPNVQMEKNQ